MTELDPESPKAHQAAEIARELTTARIISQGSEVAEPRFEAVVAELLGGDRDAQIEMLGYVLAAFTKLVGVITDSWADTLTRSGQPMTSEELFMHFAQSITALGITI